jgi:hypothetical protein
MCVCLNPLWSNSLTRLPVMGAVRMPAYNVNFRTEGENGHFRRMSSPSGVVLQPPIYSGEQGSDSELWPKVDYNGAHSNRHETYYPASSNPSSLSDNKINISKQYDLFPSYSLCQICTLVPQHHLHAVSDFHPNGMGRCKSPGIESYALSFV